MQFDFQTGWKGETGSITLHSLGINRQILNWWAVRVSNQSPKRNAQYLGSMKPSLRFGELDA